MLRSGGSVLFTAEDNVVAFEIRMQLGVCGAVVALRQ